MTVKNFNQVLSSMMEKVRSTLPDADLSSGSVIRELLEAYAQEAASAYSEVGTICSLSRLPLVRT